MRTNCKTRAGQGDAVPSVGNSKDMRLDAKYFKAHPEFNAIHDEDLAMVRFLQKQMIDHPGMIELADRAQLERIRTLVKDIDVE
jgi:hypothetical protein